MAMSSEPDVPIIVSSKEEGLPLPASVSAAEAASSTSSGLAGMAAAGALFASFRSSTTAIAALNPLPGITSTKGFLVQVNEINISGFA
jgi:hypothetical protein